MQLTIRPAQDRDLDAITEIYYHEVATSMSTFAFELFDVNVRRAWLEGLQKDNYPGSVAEIDYEQGVGKKTIGWCSVSISASRGIQLVSSYPLRA
jgi:L-amino acid N-acyltransferase YncA